MERQYNCNFGISNRSFKLVNNIYKTKINMIPKLYHYHIPRYGYCLYNFDNIKGELSTGYIIINLNDIISYKSMNTLLNGEITKPIEEELSTKLELFNIISKYNCNNYQIVYYISIYNMLKKYGNTDEIIKKRIIDKCNIFYELASRYIPELNLLISYQYDHFYIRNKYFNEFINSYITSNVKYLSVNYESNKFLIGKYYKLDIANIHKYKNNNFISCYKNNLNFIAINDLLNNNKIITEVNNTFTNPVLFTFNMVNDFISAANLSKNNESKCLDINEVSNITEPTTPINTLSMNNLSCMNYKNYKEERYKLINDVNNYIRTLNNKLNENMESITTFFTDTLSECDGTIIIGANLDYIYDDIIITNFKKLILSLGRKEIEKHKDEVIDANKTILDVIKSYTNTIIIKKINIINIKSADITKTLLETIKLNIVKGAYNILVNTELTRNNFEKIYKYIANSITGKVSNIYYDFEINKFLRLSLGYDTYYNNFSTSNNISSIGRYNNNRIKYIKLRNFIKYVNEYKANNNKQDTKDNKCCNCCKCSPKNNINYYQVKYLPYLEDISILSNIDFSIFL
jgi:hypothetical protein